jgi:antitoxin component of RelBE/YafQ-DinJ toxin-antitoxin module
MPNQPATFNKTVRVEQDLWDRAGQVATAQGLTRAAVVNAFLRWYVGELDAQLPTPATRKETDHA